MAVSNLIALFIVITTAATLNTHGVTDIQTSAPAAEALRPIAGPFAFVLFAAGIAGTGLLAVPVLAGSAAYALGEAMGWPVGLGRRPGKAKAFYAAIALGTLLGGALNFTPIDPFVALYWAAIINGVISVPVIGVMLGMARNSKVMGQLTLRGPLWVTGLVTMLVMAAAVIAMGRHRNLISQRHIAHGRGNGHGSLPQVAPVRSSLQRQHHRVLSSFGTEGRCGLLALTS